MIVNRHVTLGGVGADSHSVGLTLLRHALTADGYVVNYLGIQNPLTAFFENADGSDVVMMSCMDGHARHYLKKFAELSRRYSTNDCLWYIGGNLTVYDADSLLSDLTPLGFTRAFPQYVDLPTVLSQLKADLASAPPRLRPPLPPKSRRSLPAQAPPDERMDPERFASQRTQVLSQWKTGWRARRLDENADFLHGQPSFARAQSRAKAAGRLLVQPRSGVALVADQIAAFRKLLAAGADVLSYQIDSLTRTNAYEDAQIGIMESRERRTSTLNGFPMVNHGVDELRRIASVIRTPMQTRHSTRDPRLLAELSFAGGVTGFEGSAVCYNVPYYKDYPIAESLDRWQYVDRLTGLYFDRYGIVIDREFFGTLTAVLIPPSLAVLVNIIGAVLAASQGVRSVSLGYAEQGNRAQDVAAVRVMHEMVSSVLGNLGHGDVQINTVFHQYMAAFPDDTDRACALISASAATARLSGAVRVITKTPVEAIRIPLVADNCQGLALSRLGIAAAERIELNEPLVAQEESVLRTEVEQMLESVFACGRGSLTQGVVNAFAHGFIDIPFSPSLENRGEVLTARDDNGAVRFLNTGQLHLSADVRDFHRAKMDSRRRAARSGPRTDWALVEQDVSELPLGPGRSWPIGG